MTDGVGTTPCRQHSWRSSRPVVAETHNVYSFGVVYGVAFPVAGQTDRPRNATPRAIARTLV